MVVRRVRTTCVYCGVGCQITLKVVDDKIIQTFPVKEEPNQGKLCIKGWSVHEWVHHPDRLTTPLVRTDRKQSFQPTTWDEALNFVATQLNNIKGEYGSDSLAVLGSAKCTNEDNYVIQKFTRAVLGTNNIDHCARLCHASTVTGLMHAFGSGAMTSSIKDFDITDLVFIIGSNTTEQHPLIARRFVQALQKSKTIIVVADPRDIDIARLRTIYPESVVYLRQRVGTDVALLNGIMNIILTEGIQDTSFIESRTEGFDAFKEVIEQYTPIRVSNITGIPKEALIRVARRIGLSEKVSFVFGMGITQHTTGVDNVLSIANLALLTGNVGKPGAGVNPLRGQQNVQGACDVAALPDYLPGYQRPRNVEIRTKIAEAWNVSSLPSENGLTVVEMTDSIGTQIRGMYIMGENPVITDPESNHVTKQLAELDFLVVQDVFMNETAELAHVVLPAASFAEREGTYTNTERKVQRIKIAVPPPGEARPDWWIVGELAKRLGYEHLHYSSVHEITDEIATVTPIYRGITSDRLEALGSLQWPCPNVNHPGTEVLHTKQFTRGMGRFTPIDYRPQAEEPTPEYPLVLTTGRVLHHFHSGTLTRRSPTLVGQGNEPYIEINPEVLSQLNIADGEMVRVISRRGKIELKALASERVDLETVFIPFHFAEAAANILTIRALDPSAKIPEFKACACRVEKFS